MGPNKVYLFSVIFVLAVILIALIFSLQPLIGLFTTQGNQPLVIGVFTPLSGDAAIYGAAIQKGLDLALEEVNGEGGVLDRNVKLVYEDTHLDSTTAMNAVTKFIYVDKIPFVIAAEGSGATLAAAPLADKTKTIFIIPVASTGELRDAGDYVFRVIPSDSYRGKELAKLASEKGYKKSAILYVNDAYGVGIKSLFTETFTVMGGQVNTMESFESGSKDFRAQLSKIKAENPAAIIVAARKEFPAILKQAKELDVNSQIIASEIIESSLLKEAGDAAEGVLALDFASPTDYVGFEEKYKEKYGEDPALYSDFGYDALRVLAEGIKKANSVDTGKVKTVLYGLTYHGATGVVKFDDFGEVIEKPFVIYQVQNGAFTDILKAN